MTVRIVQKNSSAEDKRPTAAQLANGEIAVNLHESGAFLSVKDTAGNIQQVGGVKVSSQSPNNPVKGTLWVDSDDDKLYVYDGSTWRVVSGSGGGGGGGGQNVVAGDGLTGTQAGNTITLAVNAGEGLKIDTDYVHLDLTTDNTRNGLELVGTGNDKKLQVKVATTNILGSVKVDDSTITVTNDGTISAAISTPLNYKGNVNPTTESSGPDSIPTGAAGDAYTCSWGSANTEGTLASAWQTAIKGSDTTATLGDLLIINSGDGSGANEWTLVKTGTVDNSASIDVGDGTTASFPPSSPSEGDVWYNTDDARTYVFIQDSGGENEWVDVSPQGNQTLWKSDTAGIIEPQTNTDNLRIPALTSNSTAGTRIGMLDTNGTFVANTVGDGLEIDSGVLKVRDSGAGKLDLQMVTDNGNTTTNGASFDGNIKVGDYDSGSGTQLYGSYGMDVRAPDTDVNNRVLSFRDSAGKIGLISSVSGTIQLGGTLTNFVNTSSNSPAISLQANGNGEFAGNVIVGDDPNTQANSGNFFGASGRNINRVDSDVACYTLYRTSDTNPRIQFLGNGNAVFKGNVKTGNGLVTTGDPGAQINANGQISSSRVVSGAAQDGIYIQTAPDNVTPRAKYSPLLLLWELQ